MSVAARGNRAELTSPCAAINRRALKASMQDLWRLLRSAILRYGPVTSHALKIAQPNLSSSACCITTKALNVAAIVRLCVPNRGLKVRAAQKEMGWLGQETWEGNDLSGPLIGSHLAFYSFFFFISIFRNSLLHKSTKHLGTLSNA
jgi:hypothetical protein